MYGTTLRLASDAENSAATAAGRKSLGGEEEGFAGKRSATSAVDRMNARADAAAAVVDAAEDEAFVATASELEREFDFQLRELLESLNASTHLEPNLASLCARLDFNEFYSFGPGGKYT